MSDSSRSWERPSSCRELSRLLSFLILALCLLPARSAKASGPATTVINDVVYRADGSPAQGTLLISWGKSQLSALAHNYFGIKAHGGRYIELPTWECRNGERVCIAARFAHYETMEECFRERDAIILRLACYAEARAAAHDPEPFTRALAKHWATDPQYGEKLLAIWRGLSAEVELPGVMNPSTAS